ncbi:MAG: acetolactate synthase small subunit [Kiritimatiellae bacterium]|nr:acetolactate synthase small subunit [Kiritimatiellia bacterium]MDD5521069.1 acetolactate synthase small subunit [Kiritimatiellia bacterium]
MKHVITALVENQPGVLARIVGLISGRGFNIETLNVAPTLDPTCSRMTIKVPGDDRVLEQVTKQLNKLIDVIKVTDLTQKRYLNRELVLAEVAATPQKRQEIVELIKLLSDAKVVSVQEKSLTIQMIGEQDKINDFLKLLKPFRILDISRSGVIAVARGE